VTSETVDGFCPDCNRMSALQIRSDARANAPTQLYDQIDPGEDGLHMARYSMAFCPSCGGVFLHVAATSEPSGHVHEAMLFPAAGHRGIPGLPEPVRRTYGSAQSCFETGNFEPCVVMCRKCIEAMCVSFGVESGRLVDRLRELRDSGRLETRLFEWADHLRLVGNDGAHDSDGRISKQDAADSLDFVEAILLYTFTLEKRFRDFSDRRAVAKQSGSKGPSNKPDAGDG